jgi:hypothetical protein
MVVELATAIVKAPEFAKVQIPLFVVVMEPVRVKFVPVKLIPLAVLVFRFPLRKVVPVPADCKRDPAVILEKWQSLAVVIVMPPRRVPAPRIPVVISRPAVNVKLKAPLATPTVISRALFKITFDVRVIVFTKEISRPVVVILPAKLTLPPPDCEKPPAAESVFPADVVSRPELVIVMGPLPVAVAFSTNVKAVPVRLIPPDPVVFKFPLKRVETLPAD